MKESTEEETEPTCDECGSSLEVENTEWGFLCAGCKYEREEEQRLADEDVEMETEEDE